MCRLSRRRGRHKGGVVDVYPVWPVHVGSKSTRCVFTYALVYQNRRDAHWNVERYVDDHDLVVRRFVRRSGGLHWHWSNRSELAHILTPLLPSPASRHSVHCEVSRRWSHGLMHFLHSLFTSREPGGPTLLPKMSGSEIELYNE